MNRGAALAVIVVAMLLQPAAFAQDVQKAKQALDAGRVAAAADMLRHHVQDEPRDYEAWFLLGVAETRDKRYQRAISAFRRVIELRPKLAEPHDNLAAIYNQLDDVPSAVQELEQSLQKRPGHAATEENLGDLHLKLALEYYRRSLEREKQPLLAERYARLLQVRNPHVALAAAEPVAITARPQPVREAPEKPKPVQQPVAEPKAAATQPGKDATAVARAPRPADVAPIPAEKPAAKAPVATGEAAKPATAREVPAEAAPGSKAVVAATIEAWRKAWSSRDMDGYFAAYADNYNPGDRFETLAAWKQYKRRVIGNKRFIKVAIEKLHIDIDGQKAKASFRQHFRSDTYKSDDNKVLTLRFEDQGWKIVREASK